MAWKLNILPVFKGYADNWFKDKFGTYGYANQSNYMKNVDLTDYNSITQGYGIKTATNGDASAEFYELRPQGDDYLIAVSQEDTTTGKINVLKSDLSATDKLEIKSSNTISNYSNTNNYPVSCARYNSTDYLYFYNTATGGDIGLATGIKTAPVYDDDWGSTVPTGHKALQNAPHPVTQIDGEVVFGNGQYLGVYNASGLDPERYDFSDVEGIQNANVVDMAINGEYMYVGVNHGDTAYGINTIGEINIINKDLLPDDNSNYIILAKIPVYDTIGAMITINGVVYVIHGDQASKTYSLGYISGTVVTNFKTFTGDLPKFYQVDYIHGQLTFTNGSEIYSLIFGKGKYIYSNAILYSQVSAKYNIVDAVCNINGLTVITSHNDTGDYDVSYINGRTKDCVYRTVTQNVSDGLTISTINNIGIETNPLPAGARCDVYVLINQSETRILAMTLTGQGVSRHTPHKNLEIHNVESFCLEFDWSEGSASDLVKIRKININGVYGQRN